MTGLSLCLFGPRHRLACVNDLSAPPIDPIDLFRRLVRVDWPASIDSRRRLVYFANWSALPIGPRDRKVSPIDPRHHWVYTDWSVPPIGPNDLLCPLVRIADWPASPIGPRRRLVRVVLRRPGDRKPIRGCVVATCTSYARRAKWSGTPRCTKKER